MKKLYSLNYLLSRQPATIKKSNDYKNLLIFYNSVPGLKKIFISRKCYSLLNDARIKPENLQFFYKTYRLPKAAFFPLFLKIKSEYLKKNKEQKNQKQRFILTKFKKNR